MRILWVSNAHWCATGYGVQTRLALRALRDLGHEVALFAFYGLDGAVVDVEGVKVYPGGLGHFGNDLVRGHAGHWHADLVISLMDVWVQEDWGRKLAEDGRLFAPWTPIDQHPVPERVRVQLEQASAVLAMSIFGLAELRQAGLGERALYVPHMVDLDVYRPMDRAEARAACGLPADAFIVGMVANNKGQPSRKCYAEQMLAFSRLPNRDRRNVMYLHCLAGPWEGGVDLMALAASLGLEVGKDVLFADPYTLMNGYSEAVMAQLYNSFDVLSAASMGEGFGVPILEAQACGTPVITAGNTTGWELNWSGIVIERVHPFWTALNAWSSMPDVDELTRAYVTVRNWSEQQRRQQSEAARTGALEYGVAAVSERFLAPALARLEAMR